MTIAYNKFNSFVQKLTDGAINFSSQSFKVMLSNTAPVVTNAVKTDITEITAHNGYASGGATVTITESSTSGLVIEKGSTVVVTASGGTIGPFRYVVFYDATTNDLIGWWDYASSITLNDTETFTITFDATNGILQLN
jgi:hypothetical protein